MTRWTPYGGLDGLLVGLDGLHGGLDALLFRLYGLHDVLQ